MENDMAQPTFGLSITPVDNDPRPLILADMSVVGLAVTAPDADSAKYPLNTPVLINSSDDEMVNALGSTGTIAHQIDLINAQLGEFTSSARIVIVRFDAGSSEVDAMVNAIEALDAFDDAGPMTGTVPRMIAVPGYTYQQETSETANPVVSALQGVCAKLFAHAVISGPHNSLQGFLDWRKTFVGQRLIPVETWVKVGTPSVDVDSVGGVIGMIIARDNEKKGLPFWSAANRAMQGVVGANRPIQYSDIDGNIEGQQILALNGGILIGGDSSVGLYGTTFIGTDTAAEDDLWRFYNVSRGRDYIHLMFLRTLRFYLGKRNLTTGTIEDILQTMNNGLRMLAAENAILKAFEVGFEKDKNDPSDLRLGSFSVYFKCEEAPVLRHLNIESYRYLEAFNTLLDDIQSVAA